MAAAAGAVALREGEIGETKRTPTVTLLAMSMIIPNLFLGSWDDIGDGIELGKNVDVIVNVAREHKGRDPKEMIVHNFLWEDEEDFNILTEMDTAVDIVHGAIE
ncbi:MAG: hypothetical protein Hyperionvirus4_29 [Hyperionvirus sp.]|uniref:Uncharacterized protein n=1 Tax=Hyperionvirus sp. TaxID=2487770 RepID=A0A3G5A9A3_9VIRU|nr:MAG: hypothetical protein Hyperionvirus4_29 [Hyperionvirus sp.]